MLLTDHEIVERVLGHIANRTTDAGEEIWREPVENYRSEARLKLEIERVMRASFVPFCPSAALPEIGSFVAREAAGRPIVAVRGSDGVVRAFHNVCRHRGMRIASESGCVRAFVCPYHAWTYELDGRLRHIPHADGFPNLDKTVHGLVALQAVERQGLVFVSQSSDAKFRHIADGLDLIGSEQKLYSISAREVSANWKILLEGFLEGYHIRPTHPETFFAYGFDNLNVVETFDRHSRVIFPFRRIQKLADVPAQARRVTGYVTLVYHLFPNILLTVLSNHTNLLVLEPLGVDRTNLVSYSVTNKSREGEDSLEAAKRDSAYTDIGAAEDRAMVTAIQRGIGSNANEHFTFGRFETAIIHLHRTLDEALRER